MPSYVVALRLTVSLFTLLLDWRSEASIRRIVRSTPSCSRCMFYMHAQRAPALDPELDSKGVTAQRLLLCLPLSCSPSLRTVFKRRESSAINPFARERVQLHGDSVDVLRFLICSFLIARLASRYGWVLATDSRPSHCASVSRLMPDCSNCMAAVCLKRNGVTCLS